MKRDLKVIGLWGTSLLMAAVLLSGGCVGKVEDRELVAGTYVSHSRGEFASASDTLVFSVSGDGYAVLRKTGYTVFEEDGAGGLATASKQQCESERWRVVWDSGKKQFREVRRGRMIEFVPDSAYLVIGRRLYRKVD